MKKINSELMKYLTAQCSKHGVALVLYDMDIKLSEYEVADQELAFGEISSGDEAIDTAIVFHEIAHMEQDARGYFPMKMCKWGVFPRIFQWYVEKDATNEATISMLNCLDIPVNRYIESSAYLNKQLDAYKLNIFGWN